MREFKNEMYIEKRCQTLHVKHSLPQAKYISERDSENITSKTGLNRQLTTAKKTESAEMPFTIQTQIFGAIAR